MVRLRIHFMALIILSLWTAPRAFSKTPADHSPPLTHSIPSRKNILRSSVYSTLQELSKHPSGGFGIDPGSFLPRYCRQTGAGFLIFADYGYSWPLLIHYDARNDKTKWLVLDGWEKKKSDGDDQDDLWGKYWEYAAISPSGEILAILQHGVEGPGAELILIRSEDEGENWELQSALRKVDWQAEFKDLRLDKRGRGFLTIQIGRETDTTNRSGLYFYETFDRAKSWGPARSRRPAPRPRAFRELSTCPRTERIEGDTQWRDFLKKLHPLP